MIISSITAGTVLILFGAIIWKFQLVGLIAGRSRGREVDKPGLAQWIGKNMIIMGIVVCIFAWIQVQLLGNTHLVFDSAIILVLSTRMALGAAKFSKPQGKTSKKRKK